MIDIPRRIAVSVIVVVIAAMIMIVSMRGCAGAREEVAQARQETKTAAAVSDAAKDAVAAVVARQGADAAIDDIVDQASEEITHAPTPEAARAAALHALCGMRLYRSKPECQVQ